METTSPTRTTPEPTICHACHEQIHWRWNSPYSAIGEWVTTNGQPLPVCAGSDRRYGAHVPVEEVAEFDEIPATTATLPALVRPAIGTAVRVTFPGSAGYDAETVEGVVIDLDDNSLDVFAGEAIGETFTLYDIEQADPAVTVEVLA